MYFVVLYVYSKGTHVYNILLHSNWHGTTTTEKVYVYLKVLADALLLTGGTPFTLLDCILRQYIFKQLVTFHDAKKSMSYNVMNGTREHRKRNSNIRSEE